MSHGLKRRVALRLESDEAVLLTNDRIELSTRECRSRVDAIVAELCRQTSPGNCVGILFENSPSQVLAVLACILSDRIPFVLNPKGLSRRYIPDFVVTSEHYRTRGEPGVAGFYLEDSGQLAGRISGTCRKNRSAGLLETTLILETSGTTGAAKAVRVSGASIQYVSNYLTATLGLGPGTRSLVLHPLHHTFALNTQLFPSLFCGAQIAFLDPLFSTGRILREVIQTRASFLSLVSSALDYLEQESRLRGGIQAIDVLQVQLAGETIQRRHLQIARRLFPNATLFKAYGLTEALRVAMMSSNHPGFETDTVGLPLPGHSLLVRDANGRDLPLGSVGEIWAAGPTVTNGYLEESVRERVDGEYFATGDLGRLDGGLLYIEGRIDHCFKRGGVRIIPSSIEAVALAFSPVRAAVCIGATDESSGPEVVLFVETPAPAELPLDALEGRFQSGLERVRRPTHILIGQKIPRTTSGKVDYPKLLQLWMERSRMPSLPSKGRAVFRLFDSKYRSE